MPSIFSLTAAALLAAAPAVHAWEHYVTVGKGGNKYDPPYVNAEIGDKIKLEYFPMNHTLTQSPFETPCTAQPFGIDSGFKPVSDEHNTKWFEFEVKEKSPLWFYCRQAKHCSKDGMVFAVNPPTWGDKTFDAFQKLAKQQNQDAPAPPPSNNHGSGSSPSYDQGSDDKGYDDKGYDNNYKYGQPAEHFITVGKGGNKYDPPFITAKVGDKVKFQFFPKNHSLTQSSFDKPCTALGYGTDSGFQPVSDDYNTKWFELEVKDDKPTWFYCRQAQHCSKDGMVFAINADPSGDKSFDAFQALAKQQNQDAPAPSNNHGSGSGSSSYGQGSGSSGNYLSSGASAAGSAVDDSSDSGFGKWAPVVIGLLAANLAVALVLAVLTILGYIRKGGKESSRSVPVIYEPVREKDNEAFMHPSGSYRDDVRPYSEQ